MGFRLLAMRGHHQSQLQNSLPERRTPVGKGSQTASQTVLADDSRSAVLQLHRKVLKSFPSEPFLRIRLWLGNVVRANPDSGTVIFKANFPFVALFALE
ncbi:MAG: hypothetical protein Udaeo_05040 [Candidatus Udaeobacter sp.]|nr:MAG: hypothetical protein Udaeo_05040 [Candidatus Udaeobacter sp.]